MGRLSTNTSLEPTGRDIGDNGEPYVFTTVRWDPMLPESAANAAASCNRPCAVYMLEHHWSRLQVARWNVSLPRSSPAELLNSLTSAVNQWHAEHPDKKTVPLRIKHRIYTGGRTTTEIMTSTSVSLSTLFPSTFGSAADLPESIHWTVTLDDVATEASASTMYKTNERNCYDRARTMVGIKSYFEPKEVMLYNTDNEILDGSITTPYFWRGGRWVTPASASGGQQGTTRRWALEQNLCIEGSIMKGDLQEHEIVWLSNATRGYFRARFVPRQDTHEFNSQV